jgi:uncharacterized protein YecT (DUF1311 family)
MRSVVAGLALLLAALPAQAQDDAADAVASCMRDAWPRDVRALCVGVVSAPCQLAPGGETTEGMNRCLAREAGAWDSVMNRQFPELMRRAREIDAANSITDGLDAAAPALENAQRAWLLYRDGECRWAYASWGEGSFRSVAHAACLVDLTTRRVVDFHARQVNGG